MVGLDKYAITARFFPFLIVLLPVVMAIAIWFPNEWMGWSVGIGLLGATGLGVLMAELVRDPGKVKEPWLFERWGGKPTTQLLRHRDIEIDPATKSRYHKFLGQTVPDAVMPSAEQEESAPDVADASYESCVRFLLERTRERPRFGLLHQELVSYGFRRNLWGLRLAGLFTSSLGLLAAGVRVASVDSRAARGAAVGVTVLSACLLVVWIFRATEEWVRLAAFRYARTLLASCDRLDSRG